MAEHMVPTAENTNESGLYQSAGALSMDEDQTRLLKSFGDFVDISMPYLKKIALILPPDLALIGVTDKEGRLLHYEGANRLFNDLGIRPGSVMDEAALGTDGVAVCIETGHPVTLTAREESMDALKGHKGFVLPIQDGVRGMAGTLFLIIPEDLAHDNTFGMLIVAARAIRQEMVLSHQNSELASANETLSHFSDRMVKTASMLSHEVRNSLSTISAYVQLLELQQVLDHGRAEKILHEVIRVNKLLDDFKTLARPMQFRFSKYSLYELLYATIEAMRPKANMQNVDIKFSAEEEELWARVDKDSLQQVFINLILNALQAMEQGGVLKVRLSRGRDGGIVIAFEDTGVGIPEQNLSEIFKVFFTTKKSGSGLGLPLCANIIRSHGGDIKVSSTVGQGTTFTISLPSAS